jgi:hypothetical protein
MFMNGHRISFYMIIFFEATTLFKDLLIAMYVTMCSGVIHSLPWASLIFKYAVKEVLVEDKDKSINIVLNKD